jgi:glutathione peroxidase
MKISKYIVLVLAIGLLAFNQNDSKLYSFSMPLLEGETLDFSSLKGKKVLIVNTASKCGLTPQYEGLEELYKKYSDELEIVGCPANNFMSQEPGTNEEIADFCQKNYGVSFKMTEKISVKGSDMHPLYKYLTEIKNPDHEGNIRWNFEKFLFDENGALIKRYKPSLEPMAEEIINELK